MNVNTHRQHFESKRGVTPNQKQKQKSKLHEPQYQTDETPPGPPERKLTAPKTLFQRSSEKSAKQILVFAEANPISNEGSWVPGLQRISRST
ncbi:hypothetical protein K0M31_013515 [Melipona bicolor]|uniref:Uncharacterized protein n=1 Tax=Melipona bicolor TaxID=60889 RepID=A0AA40KGC2_9HYME|nr:hypothetical protein K0M31_013515 [Melipona bicolor]